MPTVHHIFIYRETLPKLFQSIERMLKSPWNGIQETLYYRIFKILHPLGYFFDSFLRNDEDFLFFVDAKDTLDLAFSLYLSAFAPYFYTKETTVYPSLILPS